MLRPLIDILMTFILLLAMSYELVGAAISAVFTNFDGYEYGGLIHEWLGISLIILFFVHLWLNRWWLKTLFKGRYNLTRIILTFINFLLIIDVIFLLISGMFMSRMFDSLDTEDFMSFARTSHIFASFWGYVIMSFHIGLNWHIFSAMMFKNLKFKNKSLFLKIMPHFTALIFMIYGGHAFLKRQLWEYMTLNSSFVFFDFDEPFIFFIFDYIAIMILFACLGHYMILFLRKIKK